jgi:DNA-binding transcriptional LysR family regulator
VELRQLAAFVAVADELHFGRAAERLGIVQPAVSQLVRRLERELGVVLFERSSHHVALTREGAELLLAARRALAARDDLATRAAALVRGERGELRIGTSEGIGRNLNLLLARFAEQRPNAGIRLEALHTPAKLKALRGGELDVAFVRAPLELSGLRCVQLWSEPLVAVLPERHPVAAAHAIPLSALSALPLMLGPRHANPGIHDELLTFCHEAGLQPHHGPELHNLQEALATIASGTAWTLLTTSNAPENMPGVAVRPLAEHDARTNIMLAWRTTSASRLTHGWLIQCLHQSESGLQLRTAGGNACRVAQHETAQERISRLAEICCLHSSASRLGDRRYARLCTARSAKSAAASASRYVDRASLRSDDSAFCAAASSSAGASRPWSADSDICPRSTSS